MNIEAWKRHFVNMTKGKTQPDKRGYYLVDSIQRGGNKPAEPSIKFVTPTAQAVELAKSELRQQEGDGIKNIPSPLKKKKRRAPTKNEANKKRRAPSKNEANKKRRIASKVEVNKEKRVPPKKRRITTKTSESDIWRR